MVGDTYILKIGDFQCTIFCDAVQSRDGVGLFPNVPVDEREQGFRDGGYDINALSFSMNILLIQGNGHNVLVDTGLGPGMSQFQDSLKAAGVDANSIDRIIITHGHGDHIGGIAGGAGFPNARYSVWGKEWDFWLDRAQNEDEKGMSRRNLPPIADKVDRIEAEGEILPGICAVHAPGHTLGHMAVLVESNGEKLLHIVDAAHHPVQVVHTTWSPSFDAQPDVSAQTRKTLFERAAAENMPILTYHFGFPGLGYIRQTDHGLDWEPVS